MIDLAVDCDCWVELHAKISSAHSIVPEQFVITGRVVRQKIACWHAVLDFTQWQTQGLDSLLGALILDLKLILKTVRVHIEHVVEDMQHIRLAFFVNHYFVNAALSYVLSDKLLGSDVRIEVKLFLGWRSEAKSTVAYAVEILYLLGATWAFKCEDSRNKECARWKGVLVVVELGE